MTAKLIILLLFSLSLLSYANAEEDKLAVIANKNIGDFKLTQDQITDIYTLNKQHWNDGTKITVFDYKGNTKSKYKFYNYIGVPHSSIQRIWLRKQFSGKAMPPKTFRTSKEIIDEVKSTPGAIGYVPLSDVTKDVKILTKVE